MKAAISAEDKIVAVASSAVEFHEKPVHLHPTLALLRPSPAVLRLMEMFTKQIGGAKVGVLAARAPPAPHAGSVLWNSECVFATFKCTRVCVPRFRRVYVYLWSSECVFAHCICAWVHIHWANPCMCMCTLELLYVYQGSHTLGSVEDHVASSWRLQRASIAPNIMTLTHTTHSPSAACMRMWSRMQYVASHWRRGDRGHPEMGHYAKIDWELSQPMHFACLLSDLVLQAGVRNVLGCEFGRREWGECHRSKGRKGFRLREGLGLQGARGEGDQGVGDGMGKGSKGRVCKGEDGVCKGEGMPQACGRVGKRYRNARKGRSPPRFAGKCHVFLLLLCYSATRLFVLCLLCCLVCAQLPRITKRVFSRPFHPPAFL